ncbi:MAG: hypothetical protein WC769_08670 [Thermodesulfovibrionales bacterium]|jgi:hypothetical protein
MKDPSISKYISIVTPYGFVVASLYLFAFWGSFRLNILEFASFSDVIRLALYPLAISLIMFLPGFALSELISGNSLPTGGGADSTIGRLGHKHWRILVAADIVIALALAMFLDEPVIHMGSGLVSCILSDCYVIKQHGKTVKNRI